VERLRALARHEHSDLSIGHEAADIIDVHRKTIEIANAGWNKDRSELTRLRAENERLLASMRIVRNELAALVPVPSADEPQWPEFFSAADYQCLTLALREARAAVELSKEPSNG
jgi:hypothetical protein